MSYKITVIPGDGIGKEITDSAVEVLKKVDEKFGLGLSYTYKDAGGTAYDKFGTPLPEDTIEACKASDGVLFGGSAATSGTTSIRHCARRKPSSACARTSASTPICARSR